MKYLSTLAMILVATVAGLFPATAVRAESPELLQGIDLYKQSAYLAAEAAFLKAREKEPGSSTAAFFLGLTYKQLAEYSKAAGQFQNAVELSPPIQEALVELVDVLIRMGQPGDLTAAEKWIGVAEKAGFAPAKITFLKGLLCGKQGRYDDAVEAFEATKKLDPAYGQSSDFQIAMNLIRAKNLDAAKERLRQVVLLDPGSDLASFARQYQDSVDKRLEDVWRFTASVSGLYDSNLLLRWNDTNDAPPWPGAVPSYSPGLNGSLRVDYRPLVPGKWLFNAQGVFSGSLYQNQSTDNDTLSGGFYMVPGYDFGRYSLNIAANYNYASKKRPYYQEASQYFSIGPMWRYVLKPAQVLEVFAGYDKKEFTLPATVDAADRDSDAFRTYISWLWSNAAGLFANIRLAYIDENANGAWWSNQGYQIVANTTIPATQRLRFQLGLQAFYKFYDNESPDPRVINGVGTAVFEQRRDDIYQATGGVNFDLMKDLMLIVQYTYTRQFSNVAIYDYNRSIFSAGLEYRF
ncbi:MAG: tetratricopeptide repeat protein [Pseudomonadota bacterium]